MNLIFCIEITKLQTSSLSGNKGTIIF